MSKFSGMSHDQIYSSVAEDGVIDSDEVSALRAEIYEDGMVDADEFGLMTRLNDLVASSEDAGHDMAGFTALYVDVTRDFVLTDESTRGVVDEGEADTLIAAWEGDGQLDSRERAAASAIKSGTTGPLPASLSTFMANHGI